ncbi:MAG: PIN domain-containing protein [Clostridiales bacterium]|jgi:predicted nucleic acid-binding protein|nr:PIN domain-containing protein [Clostridiales bacterium]
MYDTNIIMDALQERQPFDIEAKAILLKAQGGAITAMVTANSAADIFYLYSKARGMKSARSALKFMLNQYDVVDVTRSDCLNALKLSNDDFEDALVSVCTARVQGGCIVTRQGLSESRLAGQGNYPPPAALLSGLD